MDQHDEMEIPEIVGSKDLRESFKEHGRIRGSFFINNVELHQFEANSPEGLVATLNAREWATFVHASIDDGHHLVLEAHSPAPILIRAGAPYVETPPAGDHQAQAIGDAVKKAIEETRTKDDKDKDKKPKNDVLELLGLDGAAKEQDKKQADAAKSGDNSQSDRDPVKERRIARHQRAVASGAIRGMPKDLAKEASQPPAQGLQGSRPVPQGAGSEPDEQRRFNPVKPEDRAPPTIPKTRQNNPDYQLAPGPNSDHQPYVGQVDHDGQLNTRNPS